MESPRFDSWPSAALLCACDGPWQQGVSPLALRKAAEYTEPRRSLAGLQYELMRLLEEPGIAQVFDAPIDLILSPNDVLQPDLVIVSAARQHLISERGIEGVRDVCVEVLSPHTRVLDQRVKKTTYARSMVPVDSS